jgi:hypothetical protein
MSSQAQSQINRVSTSDFGILEDGSTVKKYTLRNKSNMQVELISYHKNISA